MVRINRISRAYWILDEFAFMVRKRNRSRIKFLVVGGVLVKLIVMA